MTKPRKKLFRLTSENGQRTNVLTQYAYKAGYIAKPSFQEFMEFSIRCADAVLQQDSQERTATRQKRRPSFSKQCQGSLGLSGARKRVFL